MSETFTTPAKIPSGAVNVTFVEASQSYVDYGGDGRYLPKIINYFGPRPLVSIYPFDVKEMAGVIYPEAMNSTKNRQALTPTRCVINHGYERGWCNAIHIKNFRQEEPKRKVPASPVWMHLFIQQCEIDNLPHLAALVLFMSQTAARVSEAVALNWDAVDLGARTALLVKTKTGTNSRRYLTDELVTRLGTLQRAPHESGRVFHYRSRYSVNERIQKVCERARIAYKSSHACGRHTFATNAIEMGLDIRTAMEAGDWKTAEVFLGTYVTPRRNAGRLAADRFNQHDFRTEV